MNLTFVDCPIIPVGFKIVGTIYLLLGMDDNSCRISIISSGNATTRRFRHISSKGENTMDIKNVTVAGGGVLGSQIAFQSAYCGFNVTV